MEVEAQVHWSVFSLTEKRAPWGPSREELRCPPRLRLKYTLSYRAGHQNETPAVPGIQVSGSGR